MPPPPSECQQNYYSLTLLFIILVGVYMIPGRLLPWSEFTPIPSHGSTLICLHDTTTKCHAGVSNPRVSCGGSRI